MPEGAHGYPRWQGELRTGPTFLTIAWQDMWRAWQDTWGRTALTLVFAYAVIFLGNMYTLTRRDPSQHNLDNFLFFYHNLFWGGLAVAAVMSGPALLEDHRRGALDLYLSRGIAKRDYLTGKILAVFGLTALAVIGPALLYWALGWFVFPTQPDKWAQVPLGVVAEGLLWAAMLTGLGLGLSCVSKSSRAASILLFGSFAIMDVFVSNLLEAITNNKQVQILSPMVALSQLSPVLFGSTAAQVFPWWWGAAELLLLMALGWFLVAWKHPRLAGA